jgi:hypothetical protein
MMHTVYNISVIICLMVAACELLRDVISDKDSTLMEFATTNLLRFVLAIIPILNIVFLVYIIVKRWVSIKQINWKRVFKNL